MTGQNEARMSWARAVEALGDAEGFSSFNGRANRAYYAAFHAVSGLLALDGLTYKTHQAVHSAVHRDFVHTGKWPTELGKYYTNLFDLRMTGDYGGILGVSEEEAEYALNAARAILNVVHESNPDVFPLEPPPDESDFRS